MGGIEVGIFREGEEMDYCNWRNVGDAGNAPIAHVLLDTLYSGIAFSLIRSLRQEMREGNNLPKSFPKPDSLNPPNGAATSVLLYVLIKTVPASNFSLM